MLSHIFHTDWLYLYKTRRYYTILPSCRRATPSSIVWISCLAVPSVIFSSAKNSNIYGPGLVKPDSLEFIGTSEIRFSSFKRRAANTQWQESHLESTWWLIILTIYLPLRMEKLSGSHDLSFDFLLSTAILIQLVTSETHAVRRPGDKSKDAASEHKLSCSSYDFRY